MEDYNDYRIGNFECGFYGEKEPLSSHAVLGEVPNITDENIQELREIILDSGSSRNYQNKQIREWFVRHFA